MDTWISFTYTFDSNFQEEDIMISFSNEPNPNCIKMNQPSEEDGLRLTADNTGVIICRMTLEEYKNQETEDPWPSSSIETFVSWYQLWKLHDMNAISLFQDSYESFTDEDDFTD